MTYPIIDMKATGRRIKELRLKHHLKVEEIAEFMDFGSEQAIYKCASDIIGLNRAT